MDLTSWGRGVQIQELEVVELPEGVLPGPWWSPAGAGAVTVASVRWLLSSFVMDRLQRSKGPYMHKLHPVPGI